jgi:hypothetical protein
MLKGDSDDNVCNDTFLGERADTPVSRTHIG